MTLEDPEGLNERQRWTMDGRCAGVMALCDGMEEPESVFTAGASCP